MHGIPALFPRLKKQTLSVIAHVPRVISNSQNPPARTMFLRYRATVYHVKQMLVNKSCLVLDIQFGGPSKDDLEWFISYIIVDFPLSISDKQKRSEWLRKALLTIFSDTVIMGRKLTICTRTIVCKSSVSSR